jgi:hypothetical protein
MNIEDSRIIAVPMFADGVSGRETVGTVAPRVKGRPLSDVV